MEILTVKELSELIKVKEKTLYYLVKQGGIPHYRIGKLVRFKQEEINRWIESKKINTDKSLDKTNRPSYTAFKGRPGHLKKEVINCYIKEARSGG